MSYTWWYRSDDVAIDMYVIMCNIDNGVLDFYTEKKYDVHSDLDDGYVITLDILESLYCMYFYVHWRAKLCLDSHKFHNGTNSQDHEICILFTFLYFITTWKC